MKKLLLLIALVCAVLNVSAQEDSKLSWKAGIGLSGAAGSDSDGFKSTLSYKVGVGYEYAISESFSIEPAAMINNKSFKIDGISGNINRFFLEVPVLAAYKMDLNDNYKLIINAGPYVAYGLFGSDIEWGDGEAKTNVIDSCDRFEAGIEAGARVVFGEMSVGIDFNRAITKAFKEGDGKVYSRVIGVTFGYKF